MDGVASGTAIYLPIEGIQDLTLDWRSGHVASLCLMLKHISGSTRLKRLHIELPDELEDNFSLLSSVAQALDTLPNLRTLHLPTALAVQSNVWNSLRDLPSLHTFACTRFDEFSPRDFVNNFGLHLPSLKSGFASLARLTCTITYEEAMSLTKPAATHPPLKELSLNVHGAEAPASAVSLISAISESHPDLELLELLFLGHTDPIGRTDITPLFNCKGLLDLRISNDVAANLSDDDYDAITAGLPGLAILQICSNPLPPFSTPAATLLSLSHVAKNCPSIQSVGIYLDTSHARLPDIAALSPFSRTLESISFGDSAVSDTREVALRLSRLFQNCRLSLYNETFARGASRLSVEVPEAAEAVGAVGQNHVLPPHPWSLASSLNSTWDEALFHNPPVVPHALDDWAETDDVGGDVGGGLETWQEVLALALDLRSLVLANNKSFDDRVVVMEGELAQANLAREQLELEFKSLAERNAQLERNTGAAQNPGSSSYVDVKTPKIHRSPRIHS